MPNKAFPLNLFYEMQNSSIEKLKNESQFLLKNYNISGAGYLIEDHIKNYFKSFLSSRFRITSGYIIYSKNRSENFLTSPHIDMIVIDTLVPNTIVPFERFENKFEIIPQEAVVGIFEIKKTLNDKVFKEAATHLYDIAHSVSIRKDSTQEYFLGGATAGAHVKTGIYSNPLIGIIAVSHDSKNKSYAPADTLIDIIFTFDGFLQAVSHEVNNKHSLYVGPRRSDNPYGYLSITKNSSNFLKSFGYITSYLSQTSGRLLDVHNYFFNDNFQNFQK